MNALEKEHQVSQGFKNLNFRTDQICKWITEHVKTDREQKSDLLTSKAIGVDRFIKISDALQQVDYLLTLICNSKDCPANGTLMSLQDLENQVTYGLMDLKFEAELVCNWIIYHVKTDRVQNFELLESKAIDMDDYLERKDTLLHLDYLNRLICNAKQ